MIGDNDYAFDVELIMRFWLWFVILMCDNDLDWWAEIMLILNDYEFDFDSDFEIVFDSDLQYLLWYWVIDIDIGFDIWHWL